MAREELLDPLGLDRRGGGEQLQRDQLAVQIAGVTEKVGVYGAGGIVVGRGVDGGEECVATLGIVLGRQRLGDRALERGEELGLGGGRLGSAIRIALPIPREQTIGLHLEPLLLEGTDLPARARARNVRHRARIVELGEDSEHRGPEAARAVRCQRHVAHELEERARKARIAGLLRERLDALDPVGEGLLVGKQQAPRASTHDLERVERVGESGQRPHHPERVQDGEGHVELAVGDESGGARKVIVAGLRCANWLRRGLGPRRTRRLCGLRELHRLHRRRRMVRRGHARGLLEERGIVVAQRARCL